MASEQKQSGRPARPWKFLGPDDRTELDPEGTMRNIGEGHRHVRTSVERIGLTLTFWRLVFFWAHFKVVVAQE